MRTKDFEDAIDELTCDVELIEVRIDTKGEVIIFFGRTQIFMVAWDRFGRAYARLAEQKQDNSDEDGDTNDISVPSYHRAPEFDLDFKH